LAIYNASKILPEEYDKSSTHKKYFLVKEAENIDFKKLAHIIDFIYPYWSKELQFKTAIRIKK
jgi:hypothetical protein